MIRWINEKLGTAPASDQSISSDAVVLDVRDLVDRFGNTAAVTKEKIEQGLALLRQGKRVIVCCDYGISRSNAIAAGILSRYSGISLNQAIKVVVHATGEQQIKLEPLRSVRNALQDEMASIVGGKPRVLLTGGAGFIGQALFFDMSKNYYVVAPSRNEVDLAAGALALDLMVKEHRVNFIVHLASPRVYTTNRAVGETVTSLCNVLDVCRENNIHLIFPSSWEVYAGYHGDGIVPDNNLPRFPKGPYGEAKLLCETMIEHYAKSYGLKYALLRSAMIYGGSGNRPKFIHAFIDKARKNEPIKTHFYLNGEPKIDLLHVKDFCSAVIAAVEFNFVGSLNIGSGCSISTGKIAKWIISKTNSGSTHDIRNIEDYTANITMDISSARNILSWQPAMTWEIGLGRLLENSADR